MGGNWQFGGELNAYSSNQSGHNWKNIVIKWINAGQQDAH